MAFIDLSRNPNAQGTEENDLINDTPNDNRRILGFGGNDRINGYGGNDELFGNTGEDSLNGGLGNDSLYGGRDNDALDGQEDNDLLFGNLGADVLVGNAGNDRIFGGRDSDVLSGLVGADFLSGDLGFDVLIGGFGNDTLVLRDETVTDSFDYLRDFIPGEDKIALGGGLSFADLDILTVGAARIDRAVLRSQFAPWGSNLSDVSNESLVLRVRSTNRVLGILNHRPTNTISATFTLTPNSLGAIDFIAI
ncbi:MAG: calcium-binding protein [Oscillatoriales cyanobacterium RU_3_3]|nr:calcium-binding protein [Oscillatoriales cyanobacterium RU_3_3]NJR25633.1 calcium-binding protein [Richelia sp. CSU_2_1]